MVPVKIECECGQNYAFDVEPANARMPSAVSCPNCGADGTAAANDFISQHLALAHAAIASPPPQSTPAPAPVPAPMRLARPQTQSAAGTSSSSASPGTVPEDAGRAKLVREARTKIVQGESMEQVTAFLKIKGFNPAEAMELAYGFYQERVSIVRSNGVKKTIVGLVLMAVPIVVYFIFRSIGRFYIKRSILAYVVGIVGAYMFVSGIIMILAPKSEKGTVVKE